MLEGRLRNRNGGKEMKIECDIVRDLLPLYVEGMVREKSREAIEGHLEECEDCKAAYQEMSLPEPRVQFDTQPAESFRRYVKKKKWQIALITMLVLVVWAAVLGGLILSLGLMGRAAEVEMDTDPGHYARYMGENADEKYRDKWGMDESIFPEAITADMEVKEYKMVYYNPWDKQYLSYLIVEYGEEAYREEIKRLMACPQEEYTGYYGAEGFAEQYELLAMSAHPTWGFVYALADGDCRIIYVEVIFPHYFMDLDYTEYIDTAYLPLGFDATVENPYRQEKLNH